LPSQYSTEGKLKEPNLALEAGQGLLGAVSSYARGDIGGVLRSVTGFVKTATTERGATQRARQTKTSPADVVRMLSLTFIQAAQMMYRYHGAGARTRRQVQMLSRRALLPVL
jgi:hypothetical protein